MVKNFPAKQEMASLIPELGGSLEKEVATNSSILA